MKCNKFAECVNGVSEKVAPYAKSVFKYAEDTVVPSVKKIYKSASEGVAPYGEAAAETVLLYTEKARDFADDVASRTNSFSSFDWVILKIMLVSLGMLLATVMTKFLKKIAPLIFIIALVSSIYTIWRLFFCCCDD